MGRKYGRGKYGRGTYDLGATGVVYQFEGDAIHIPINITSDEYIGPFWKPIYPGIDFWIPITEPPPQFRI
jgi:hypothetical protein